MQRCLFCGGDASEPDHLIRCDGRQGGVVEPDEPQDIPVIRDSSITAFYNSVASGVVKKRKEQVWAALEILGVATANEVMRYVKQYLHHDAPVFHERSLTPRFAQLRDEGLIREVGERVCSVTKQICLTWEVVPSDEYRPLPVVKHRCVACGQVTGRTVR